jgi:hypothetical protein
MSEFEKLPSRVRHYLLEWKDDHLEAYCSEYGELKLRDMTHDQLQVLFTFASSQEFQN